MRWLLCIFGIKHCYHYTNINDARTVYDGNNNYRVEWWDQLKCCWCDKIKWAKGT